ncbi:MAG: TlpA family protein disulfide reductase [Chryseobacterium sp.]
MKVFKIWIQKNWSTTVLVIIFIILFVSPDAKAWLMRQVLSTGFLNSKIEGKASRQLSSENPVAVVQNLSVIDDNREIINTSQLRGKVVFINFWASWCPPCRAEFPSIQAFYDKYKGTKNLVFLTVNLDDDAVSGKMYLKKEQFSIPFLIPNGAVPNEYFSGSLPTTVILDKSGKIRMHHTGMADYSKNSFYQQINQLLNEQQ